MVGPLATCVQPYLPKGRFWVSFLLNKIPGIPPKMWVLGRQWLSSIHHENSLQHSCYWDPLSYCEALWEDVPLCQHYWLTKMHVCVWSLTIVRWLSLTSSFRSCVPFLWVRATWLDAGSSGDGRPCKVNADKVDGGSSGARPGKWPTPSPSTSKKPVILMLLSGRSPIILLLSWRRTPSIPLSGRHPVTPLLLEKDPITPLF